MVSLPALRVPQVPRGRLRTAPRSTQRCHGDPILLRRYLPDVHAPLVTAANFRILSGYLGPAYGAPNDAGCRARALVSQSEGIELDTTYTAKCMADMIDAVRMPEYRRGPVLFWNTFSSVDPARHLGPVPDYRQLPGAFHRFFMEAAVPV